jgi:signal transduction histidine kinase
MASDPAERPARAAGRSDIDLDQLRAVTAGLAHEIRNPLQFIKNYAEVAAELATELRNIVADDEQMQEPTLGDLTSLYDELHQAADQIGRHVMRLDAIVESMSAAASESSGRRQLTDINLLARESAEFAYHGRAGAVAGPRVERLVFELDAELPPAVVDPVRLSRAVINLVGNALQAISSASPLVNDPCVTVRSARTDDGFELSVEDNGPGIPAEIRDRVFEPFFTATRGRHHAGLGLTQVWDIAVNHGGSVTIDSDATHGTVVTLRLPASSGGEPATN